VTDPPEPGRRAGRARPGGREGGRTGGRRSGRRGGDSGTREAILAAARALFGDLGYDRATIRRIADDAGVDPALVHHFFGTKEGLFVAAMRLPVNPLEILDAALAPGARDEGVGLGEHLLRIVLSVWDVAEMRATFLGMLRSATTSEQAAAMLREFATGSILSRVAQLARAAPDGDGDAGYRAALVASQVLGLALTRYVLELDALKQASPDDLAAAIGPTLDRYLTGDLR
jgi:AcrR family transcriptional regulator